MTLLAALAGSLTVIGLWLIARGLRPQPQTPPPPARPRVSLVSRIASMKRGTRIRLAIATLIGIAAALVTGWVVLVVLVPAVFMSNPSSAFARPKVLLRPSISIAFMCQLRSVGPGRRRTSPNR